MQTLDRSDTWLLPELRKIRMRVGMYLRDDRLNSLACHIDGIIYGLQYAGIKNTVGERFLRMFGDWLGKQLGCQNGDCWFYLVRCLPEASGHVDDFYGQLDRYLRSLGFEHGLDDSRIDLSVILLREVALS